MTGKPLRSEEHTSELQSLREISYAVQATYLAALPESLSEADYGPLISTLRANAATLAIVRWPGRFRRLPIASSGHFLLSK